MTTPTTEHRRDRSDDDACLELSRTALAVLLVGVFAAGAGLAVVVGAGGIVGTADAGTGSVAVEVPSDTGLHPCENATQEAYGGNAPEPPATIDAAHFDEGGEGVAYHDGEPARRDDSGFRPEAGVDVEAPSKGGSGEGSIGYVEPGEWVEYTVTADPGTYSLSVRVASHLRGSLAVSVDGKHVGTVTERTGGPYEFRSVEVGTFTIEEAGEHVIRVRSTERYLNLDRLSVEHLDQRDEDFVWEGTVEENETSDSLTLRVEAGQAIRLVGQFFTGRLTLYDPSDEVVLETEHRAAAYDHTVYGVVANETGTYRVEIAKGEDRFGTSYYLKPEVADPDPAGENDARSEAAELSPGETVHGRRALGDADWFAVQLSEGERLTANLTVRPYADWLAFNDLGLTVHAPDGERIGELRPRTSPSNRTDVFGRLGENFNATQQATAPTDGTYYVRVTAHDLLGYTGYDLSVSVDGESLPNSAQRPYGGDAPVLSMTVDAAHFDEGGEGVAYHDGEPARRDDSGFRPEAGVDVEDPALGGSGDGSVGYVEGGEWLEYTVTTGPGTYTLSVDVSSHLRGRLAAFVDGRRVGNVTARTGGAYQFETVTVGTFTVEEAGEHVIRIESLGPYLNLDRIEIRWTSE